MLESAMSKPKELVLLGGGHSHVEVLRVLGATRRQRQRQQQRQQEGQSRQHQPPSGQQLGSSGVLDGPAHPRVTLVSRGRYTPYSGMLPGYVSGFYTHRQCHIDLQLLADYCGAQLIEDEAVGIDPQARRVLLRDHDPVPYDVLSLDIGIAPSRGQVPGAELHTTPVKPIDGFVERFELLLQRYRAAAAAGGRSPPPPAAGGSPSSAGGAPAAAAPGLREHGGGGLRVCVVGGGAGGMELAAAVQYRLEEERRRGGWPASSAAQVALVCRGGLLPGHPPHVRALAAHALAARGVEVHADDAVCSVSAGCLHLASGAAVPFGECLWCTEAAPAEWLRGTGLPTDARGFLAINEFLQSDGGPPEVFAAGDVASCARHPRPKAGVFAVRQGPALAANLLAHLEGRPLARFVPQETALALISLGDRSCLASVTRGTPQLGSNTASSGGGLASAPASAPAPGAAAGAGAAAPGGQEWWVGWLLNGCGGALGAAVTGPLLWRWKDHIDRAFMDRYGAQLGK